MEAVKGDIHQPRKDGGEEKITNNNRNSSNKVHPHQQDTCKSQPPIQIQDKGNGKHINYSSNGDIQPTNNVQLQRASRSCYVKRCRRGTSSH